MGFPSYSTGLHTLLLILAIIVMGLLSDHIEDSHDRPPDRILYTLVLSVLSFILGFIRLFPCTNWLSPLDLLFFISWIVSFGLLVDWATPMNCRVNRFHQGYGYQSHQRSSGPDAQCQRWIATLSCILLNAIFWFFSAFLGLVHGGLDAYSQAPQDIEGKRDEKL